jgi:hypothetical protein
MEVGRKALHLLFSTEQAAMARRRSISALKTTKSPGFECGSSTRTAPRVDSRVHEDVERVWYFSLYDSEGGQCAGEVLQAVRVIGVYAVAVAVHGRASGGIEQVVSADTTLHDRKHRVVPIGEEPVSVLGCIVVRLPPVT